MPDVPGAPFEAEDLLLPSAAPAKAINLTIGVAEICCGPKSKIAGLGENFPNFVTNRITIVNDLTTSAGLEQAVQNVRSTSRHNLSAVWFSLPCAGGTPLANIDVYRDGGQERYEQHVELFEELVTNARVAMQEAKDLGVKSIFDLSERCRYWSEPLLQQVISEFDLNVATCPGCSVGLSSTRFGFPLSFPLLSLRALAISA